MWPPLGGCEFFNLATGFAHGVRENDLVDTLTKRTASVDVNPDSNGINQRTRTIASAICIYTQEYHYYKKYHTN